MIKANPNTETATDVAKIASVSIIYFYCHLFRLIH